MVQMYLFPLSVGGKIGPTKPPATLSNDVSVIGIFPNGTLIIFPLAIVL